jgi:predicted signal transduction protein with EAL and GGDEF domain
MQDAKQARSAQPEQREPPRADGRTAQSKSARYNNDVDNDAPSAQLQQLTSIMDSSPRMTAQRVHRSPRMDAFRAYLDLDRFNVVNDTCGHLAGDTLLIQLSGLLSASLRQHYRKSASITRRGTVLPNRFPCVPS